MIRKSSEEVEVPTKGSLAYGGGGEGGEGGKGKEMLLGRTGSRCTLAFH